MAKRAVASIGISPPGLNKKVPGGYSGSHYWITAFGLKCKYLIQYFVLCTFSVFIAGVVLHILFF